MLLRDVLEREMWQEWDGARSSSHGEGWARKTAPGRFNILPTDSFRQKFTYAGSHDLPSPRCKRKWVRNLTAVNQLSRSARQLAR